MEWPVDKCYCVLPDAADIMEDKSMDGLLQYFIKKARIGLI